MSETAVRSDDPDLAETVVSELESYQQRSMAVLATHEVDPGEAVRALVALHLTWTEEDPDRARTVSRHRNEVAGGPLGKRLAASNRQWFEEMKDWIDSQSREGRMKPVSFNLLHAVVFAPTQEIAKLWLAGRLKRPLSDYAAPLGDAAAASVSALPAR
jgi:hypothetical protein